MQKVSLLILATGLALTLGGGEARAAGDAAKGEKIFAKCKVCHTLVAGKNLVGPSLHGVVGRKSGTAPGFKYSQPMIDKALVWDKENLEKYLRDPKGYIPGNKMIFPGLKQGETDDVIAYLNAAAK